MKTYGKMLKPKRAEVKKNVIKSIHPGCRVYNPSFLSVSQVLVSCCKQGWFDCGKRGTISDRKALPVDGWPTRIYGMPVSIFGQMAGIFLILEQGQKLS